MKQLNKKRHPIFRKIFLPILCLMILQSIIFYIATVYGGVIGALNQNAADILSERVINREKELETQYSTRWTNMGNCMDIVTNLYNNLKKESDSQIYDNTDLQKEILEKAAPSLISMLRSNDVNGVFLILNNSKEYQPLKEGEKQEKYGICIRDYDPVSNYTSNEDLLAVRCPSSIVPSIGCPLDSWWEALYSFDGSQNSDFYYKPLKAAYDNLDSSSSNLAYFSGTHQFSDSDKTVVSYSLPLFDNEGYPYAVMGIELTTSYLESMLPSEELYGANIGSYALVQSVEGSTDYTVVAYDGVMLQRYLGADNTLSVKNTSDKDFFYVNTQSDENICASVSNLTLYNRNTPFDDEHLGLMGIVNQNTLFTMGNSVKEKLLIVAIITLVVGTCGILLISRRLTAPIKKLADDVRIRGVNPKLERIKIDEIDELVNALEDMSDHINKSQVRTEFFSRMSHDMRTPMNAIIGFSSPEILENATVEQKDEYLHKIQASGTYLLGLINEVLDITKIESEKLTIHEEPLSLKSFWDDTLPIIEEVAIQRGVIFEKIIRENDLYVYADRQRLSQIFVNLLSNAVKFTPKDGRVTLNAYFMKDGENTVTYRISVKDTGIGMSEEFQKTLYQPFTREHENSEGTGLGLSITKELVELMNGTIVCHSELGKGTEFIVTLTTKVAPVPKNVVSIPVVKTAEEKNTVSKDLTGKRILLCEDHPLNMQISKKLLEKRGILVDCAENGEIGVEKFKASEESYYDAILMDIRMPVMNGLEATKAIRALERQDAKEIPIFAMTANAFAEDIKDSSEAGMNEHLSKPIEPVKLYNTLEKYLCNFRFS